VASPLLTAKSYQTVEVRGTYRGGASRFVQAERREGGKWVAYPVPAKSDKTGRFTAFVDSEAPGRYRLRVVDPQSGVTSKEFVLVVTG
jgi:hypothetical protein